MSLIDAKIVRRFVFGRLGAWATLHQSDWAYVGGVTVVSKFVQHLE